MTTPNKGGFIPRRLSVPLRGAVDPQRRRRQVSGGPDTLALNQAQESEDRAAAAAAEAKAAAEARASSARAAARSRAKRAASRANRFTLEEYAGTADEETAAAITEALASDNVGRGFEIRDADVQADYTSATGAEWSADPAEREQVIAGLNTRIEQSNAQIRADYTAATGAEWSADPAERERVVADLNTGIDESNARIREQYSEVTGAEWSADPEERERVVADLNTGIDESNARIREQYSEVTGAEWSEDPEERERVVAALNAGIEQSNAAAQAQVSTPAGGVESVAPKPYETATETYAQQGVVLPSTAGGTEPAHPDLEPEPPSRITAEQEEYREALIQRSRDEAIPRESAADPDPPAAPAGARPGSVEGSYDADSDLTAATPAPTPAAPHPDALSAVYAEDIQARDDAIRDSIRGALAAGNLGDAHSLAQQYLPFHHRPGKWKGTYEGLTSDETRKIILYSTTIVPADQALGALDVVGGRLAGLLVGRVARPIVSRIRRPLGSADPVLDANLQAQRKAVAREYLRGGFTSEQARAGLVQGPGGAGIRPPATTVIATTKGRVWTPPPVEDGPWGYLRATPPDITPQAGLGTPGTGPGGSVAVATSPTTTTLSRARAAVDAINLDRAARSLNEAASQQAAMVRRQAPHELSETAIRRHREAFAAQQAAGTGTAYLPTPGGLLVPEARTIWTPSGEVQVRPSESTEPLDATQPGTRLQTEVQQQQYTDPAGSTRPAAGTELAARAEPVPYTDPAGSLSQSSITGQPKILVNTEPDTSTTPQPETVPSGGTSEQPAARQTIEFDATLGDRIETAPQLGESLAFDRSLSPQIQQFPQLGQMQSVDLGLQTGTSPAVEVAAAGGSVPPPSQSRQGVPPEERPPPRRTPRPRLPSGPAPSLEAGVKVVGPPDGYARRIQHTERVEYSYDPETQKATARVVESSDPVIVARDASPPQVQERQVGAFDVVPEGRNIRATAREDAELPVPAGVMARLRGQAERDGGPLTRTETVSYEHDIDTQETDQRIERSQADRARTVAAVVAGGARTAAARTSTAVRRAAAGAVDAAGSAVGQYEAGRTASQEERATAEQRQGQAQAEYQAALQHYEDVQKQAGASGRLRSLAGRIRGDEEPDELRDARQRLQEAAQSVREAQKTERASLGGIGSAGRLIERAERGGRGAYAKGREIAASEGAQKDLKTLKSLDQPKKVNPATKPRRRSPASVSTSKRAERFVKMLLAQEAAQKKAQQGQGKRRRKSASKAKEKRPPYQQPTYTIIREPAPSGRRYGGL